MPMHDFVCTQPDCGLTFEKLVPMGSDDTPPCRACGGSTDRKLSGFGAMRFEVGQDLTTTGVDSLDNKPDKKLGRDAHARWERIKDREHEKRRVRRQSGDPDAPLRSDQGEYRVAADDDREKFLKMHAINDAYEKDGDVDVEWPDD